MSKLSIFTALEKQRLFESGDLFKNYHTVVSIYGILKNLGLSVSRDGDWFRAVANYLTQEEIQAIYDKIIPPDRRSLMSDGRRRPLPEIDSDDPEDILSCLSKNLVHRKKLWHLCALCYEKRVEQYEEALANENREPSATEVRFKEMQKLFDLTDKEVRLLMVVFLSSISYCDLGDYDVGRYRNSEKVAVLAKALSLTECEVSEMLSDNGNISRYCLMDNELDIDRTFMSYLSGISQKPLSQKFFEKYTGDVIPLEFYGGKIAENAAIIKKMIKAREKENRGISIVLLGPPGAGKTSFAVAMAKELGKEAYLIAQNDSAEPRRGGNLNYSAPFRFGALAAAQKSLDKDKSVLVVDEADKLIENSDHIGGGLFSFFGIKSSRDGDTKGQLNSVLDQNEHILILIANSHSSQIHESSLRRFDFSICFDTLSADVRVQIWKNSLELNNCQGKLSEEFLKAISTKFAVSPGGISSVVKNAAAISRSEGTEFADEVMTFLKAHCRLLNIPPSPEDNLAPSRDYSLEGINVKTGIKLPRLVEACRRYLDRRDRVDVNRDKPKISILLHGVPGAGKTEFCKHLSKQLGMKLSIKNGRDILDCYVGGTEKNLAKAFADAEENNEILVVDEGDSLLGARTAASRNYEVSRTATLLSQMENFNGIFILCTNLVQNLDPASLRRFTFRCHFDYLENFQKEILFRKYFTEPMELPELTEAEKESLFTIDKVTPSDFRNVRQQFFWLQESKLTNGELIEALASEIESRDSASNYKGLGSAAQQVGF